MCLYYIRSYVVFITDMFFFFRYFDKYVMVSEEKLISCYNLTGLKDAFISSHKA